MTNSDHRDPAPRLSVTYPTALVLQALVSGYSYGFDIMEVTGLPSGTVYPILRRLERAGCALSRWEDEGVAQGDGRPARRYYEIAAEGRALLARARERFSRTDPALAALPPGAARP